VFAEAGGIKEAPDGQEEGARPVAARLRARDQPQATASLMPRRRSRVGVSRGEPAGFDVAAATAAFPCNKNFICADDTDRH